MKGLVKFSKGKNGMELRNLPEPVAEKRQLKVKVEAAGICGSDIHIMRDEIKIDKVVMGHEYVGTVAEVGEDVNEFKKGDWIVSMTPYSTCGTCDYCKAGKIMFCPERKTLGFHVNGTMAEYVIVNADNAFKVPDEIDDKLSVAALEPFSCGARCAGENTPIKPGDICVISGPGTLGLSAMQIAKLRGAYVIVYGLPKDAHRLNLAQKLGADDIADDLELLKKKVREKNKYGADVVFESSGVAESMANCLDIVRKDGYLGQLSVYGKKIIVDMDKFVDNEIHLTNSFGAHRSTWKMTLELLRRNQVNIREFTTERFPLDQWEEAFDLAASGNAYKVLLIPQSS